MSVDTSRTCGARPREETGQGLSSSLESKCGLEESECFTSLWGESRRSDPEKSQETGIGTHTCVLLLRVHGVCVHTQHTRVCMKYVTATQNG